MSCNNTNVDFEVTKDPKMKSNFDFGIHFDEDDSLFNDEDIDSFILGQKAKSTLSKEKK